MSPRVRVAVVYGGQSSEHAISCVSAGGILRALDPSRFDVVAIGITRDGRWVTQAADPSTLAIAQRRLPEVTTPGDEVLPVRHVASTAVRTLSDIDVVFPVLHGPFGEDGTIQGLLELAGVPYVGSGVLASALAMDKAMLRCVLRDAGLPVVQDVVITDAAWRHSRTTVLQQVAALGLPVFVKPARAGSSIGITRVTAAADLVDAIEVARQHDPRVVVEQGLTGIREIEVAVIQDAEGRAIASCAGEVRVRSGHDFYDFEAKYLDDAADLVAPADLDVATSDAVRALAVRAFDVVGCEGLARVDFFLTPEGGIVLNEINTMPGFTPISMFPRMWAASGMDYSALVAHLIDDAVRRGTGLR